MTVYASRGNTSVYPVYLPSTVGVAENPHVNSKNGWGSA